MDPLKKFAIPISGLKNGIHQFNFQVDKGFFDAFEESIIKDGLFDVQLDFDKRVDMFVLVFTFNGTARTNCDRCLEKIDLPIEGTEQLIVKVAETPSEEDEIVYITDTLSSLNVAKYIYEYIHLGMPLIKVYDCENDDPMPCNEKILDILDQKESEENKSTNPVWDELKKLNNN